MNAYEKLRQKIDSIIPIPSPETKSKVEIEILSRIMTPEDAEMACNLSAQPEDVKTIAERIKMDPEKLKPILDELVKKGAIFKFYLDNPLYCLVPMMPGLHEFRVGRITPDMVQLFERYYVEGHGEAVYKNETAFSRVVPVKEAIRTELNILTFEEVEKLIDNAASVTLARCLCRTNKKMIGEGCEAPVDDICILLDSWADYYANNGLGRSVSKEEGKKALQRAEEAGLVHCALNVQEGALFICNCCGCCCLLLRGITQLKIPTAVAKSNFMAQISEEDCVGCEECIESCHFNALEVRDSIACLLEERCVGCGLCVSACPGGAISMKRRERQTAPPQTINDLMMGIAQGRT